MIDAQEIVKVIEKAVEVPALPQAVIRLAQVIADPDHTRGQLLQVIRSDTGLVADALKAANTANIRRSNRPIDTPEAALGLLGEQWLMRVVLARSVDTVRSADLPGYGLGHRGLWDCAIRMALSAELVASRVDVVPQVAYTAALIADLGKLVLSDFLERLRGALAPYLEDEMPFDAIERTVLGIDHAELGARLAESWELPDSLVTAVRYHHRPHDAPDHQALCHVVHAGDYLSTLTGCALGIDGLKYRVTSDPMPELVLGSDDVDRITTSVESRVRDLEQTLGL